MNRKTKELVQVEDKLIKNKIINNHSKLKINKQNE
jgi:hypothetical protein